MTLTPMTTRPSTTAAIQSPLAISTQTAKTVSASMIASRTTLTTRATMPPEVSRRLGIWNLSSPHVPDAAGAFVSADFTSAIEGRSFFAVSRDQIREVGGAEPAPPTVERSTARSADLRLDVAGSGLPHGGGVAAFALDDRELRVAPVRPHGTHLGDRGHRRAGLPDLAEGRHVGVVGRSLLVRRGECRRATADLVEANLRVLGAEVVDDEVRRRERVLGLARQEEAVHTDEGLGLLATGAGERVDGVLDAGVLDRGDVPGTGQVVGRLAGEEELLGLVTVDVGVDDARTRGTLRREPRGEGGAGLVAEDELRRVVAAVRVLGEDLRAERRLQRVQVVWVTLLGRKAHEEGVLGAGGLAVGDDLVVRGRRVRHEVGVAHERDVLDRVRNAVDLAVVRHGLDGRLREAVGDVAELERGHDTGRHVGAELVVGADDDVGALAGGDLADEVLVDRREVLGHELDLDAGLLRELLRDRLE